MSNFHGGISLPPAEGTTDAVRFPVAEVCLVADQLLVKVGDTLSLGQPVGTIAGRSVLASIAGKVTHAADGRVKIVAVPEEALKGEESFERTPFGIRTGKTLAQSTPEELLAEIASVGIVEADGSILANRLADAMALSAEGKLRQAAVSLLEPDPASLSLTSLGEEFADAIAGGVAILCKLLSLREGTILCDKARPQALDAIRTACEESRLIAVEAIENRYPQHHPRLVTRYLCQRELSYTSTPEKAGLFLIDAESCVALHSLFATGVPRLSVRTTLWENGEGRVFDFPLGTPLTALREAGLFETLPALPSMENKSSAKQSKPPMIKSGEASPFRRGLMDGGIPGDYLDRSVTVLTVAEEGMTRRSREGDCIRCGNCSAVCPMFLNPAHYLPQPPLMRLLAGASRDAACCIGCGCCSYVCPANLPLRRYALRQRQEELLSRKV